MKTKTTTWNLRDFKANQISKLLKEAGYNITVRQLKESFTTKEVDDAFEYADAVKRKKKDPSVKLPKKPAKVK